jgi:hypothetical protein
MRVESILPASLALHSMSSVSAAVQKRKQPLQDPYPCENISYVYYVQTEWSELLYLGGAL